MGVAEQIGDRLRRVGADQPIVVPVADAHMLQAIEIAQKRLPFRHNASMARQVFHTRAFAAIGGVPQLIVPDNAKVAVIKACLYEPQDNRTYAEMAAHYGTAVLPARPRRPRDMAVNGPRNLPSLGRAKFPTLAGVVISRWFDRFLRFLVAGRGAWALP